MKIIKNKTFVKLTAQEILKMLPHTKLPKPKIKSLAPQKNRKDDMF